MITVDNLTTVNPNHIGLNITPNIEEQAWSLAQKNSHNVTRWQSFLNLVTLKTLIPCLEDLLAENEVNIFHLSDNEILEITEFVNGFAINIDSKRLIFIPSETDDLGEINVPQEWVDIRDFAGDYYIAVQINPDEHWLRIWGYTTYQKLKNEADYDVFTRSYSLEEDYLDEDIIFLFVASKYVEKENHFIPELPLLNSQRITQILDNLKSLKDYSLRLLIPFAQWGFIFSHSSWRKELYDSRQPLNLTAWIQYNFSQAVASGWRTLEELGLNLNLGLNGANGINGTNGINGLAMRSPTLDISFIYNSENEQQQKIAIEAAGKLQRNSGEAQNAITALTYVLRSCDNDDLRWSAELSLRNLDPYNEALGIWRGKIIDLGLDLEANSLILVIGTLPKTDGKTSIFLRVYSRNQKTLPDQLKVQILDTTGREFNSLLSRGVENYLQYKFWGDPQEQFSICLSLGEGEITETFVI